MEKERNFLDMTPSKRREMVEAARELRKHPTQGEDILWQCLRSKKLEGIKFRRQQPVGPYVVDFFAPAIRLVIEIDGPVHAGQREADELRQSILESLGMQVIRFSEDRVEDDAASVFVDIKSVCKNRMK